MIMRCTYISDGALSLAGADNDITDLLDMGQGGAATYDLLG